ncbi:MAG: hypothetical protein IBX43_09410 [Campylobacterales bacterium]|nr:hypothetical protein [Campylobacterales bacterium]
MRRYKSWLAITILMLLFLAAYFIFNPSYQKSFEAKLYYSLGDYDKAYLLSKEAFDLEPYNRMANSVMVQSQYALRYVNYNKEAQQYLSIIRSYALQEKITLSQQMRMKMMCDIMIEKHQKMQPTILIDKALVEQSRQYYEQFVKLHEQITKAI